MKDGKEGSNNRLGKDIALINNQYHRRSYSGDNQYQRSNYSGDNQYHRRSYSGDNQYHRSDYSGDNQYHRSNYSGDNQYHRRSYNGDIQTCSLSESPITKNNNEKQQDNYYNNRTIESNVQTTESNVRATEYSPKESIHKNKMTLRGKKNNMSLKERHFYQEDYEEGSSGIHYRGDKSVDKNFKDHDRNKVDDAKVAVDNVNKKRMFRHSYHGGFNRLLRYKEPNMEKTWRLW